MKEEEEEKKNVCCVLWPLTCATLRHSRLSTDNVSTGDGDTPRMGVMGIASDNDHAGRGVFLSVQCDKNDDPNDTGKEMREVKRRRKKNKKQERTSERPTPFPPNDRCLVCLCFTA